MKHRSVRGFTLLEMVVVIVIFTVMITIALLSLGSGSAEGDNRRQADKMADWIQHFREKSILTGVTTGLTFYTESAQSPIRLKWQQRLDGVWHTLNTEEVDYTQLPDDFDVLIKYGEYGEFTAATDIEKTENEQPVPHIQLFPDGRVSEASIAFENRHFVGRYELIKIDLLGRITRELPEETGRLQ